MNSPDKISVIIPVFNEARVIEKTLKALLIHPSDVEIIVVDGGSQDETVAITQSYGVKVIISEIKGRAAQMNLGASLATGNMLLFLHADTHLPPNYSDLVRSALSESKTIAGAFKLKIDGNSVGLRIIESLVNWRSHFFSLPYGDQGLFLKTAIFQQLHGFANLPIMEDFELIQRLKPQGKIRIVNRPAITSSRRWDKLGMIKTTLINQLMVMGYYLKVPPEKLAQWYRNQQ